MPVVGAMAKKQFGDRARRNQTAPSLCVYPNTRRDFGLLAFCFLAAHSLFLLMTACWRYRGRNGSRWSNEQFPSMHGRAFAPCLSVSAGILSQHRYRARINLLADTPNMQIGDASTLPPDLWLRPPQISTTG